MLSKKDIRFYELASQLAAKSMHKKAKVGAVIVKQSKVIAIGINKYKTHPQQKCNYSRTLCGKSIHAELDAMIGSNRNQFNKATIYISRVGQFGDYKISKPCPLCMAIIRDVGIKRIVYHNGINLEKENI